MRFELVKQDSSALQGQLRAVKEESRHQRHLFSECLKQMTELSLENEANISSEGRNDQIQRQELKCKRLFDQ